MAVSVAAQAEFAAPRFKYIGCVEAEPPVFSVKADLPAPFSVQQCQDACHAKGKYAAMDGSCNCYDSSSKAEPSYNILDESVCSLPCISGNRTAGVCGGPQCEVTGKKRYSLYKQEVEHDDDDGYEKEDKQEMKHHDGTDYEKENKQKMENYDGDDCEEENKQEMEHYDGDDCEEEDKKEMDHHDCDHCEKEDKQEMKHYDGDGFEKEDKQGLKYHDGTDCEKENKKEMEYHDGNDFEKEDRQKMEHHDGNGCEKENKKEMEHHDGDGWEKEDKSKETGIQTKYITSTVKTITACPPEVTNCPLSPNKTTPHCPGEGCHIPTTSADPAKPACPEKCSPPCPPEGCAACPPGGCLPACPPGCPHPPACDGEHCKIGLPTSLACPSGGCFHPHPTVIVSEGTRYQSGVLIALAAAAMAVGWL